MIQTRNKIPYLPNARLSTLTLSAISLASRYNLNKQLYFDNDNGTVGIYEAYDNELKTNVAFKIISYESVKDNENYFKHLIDNLITIDRIKSLPSQHENIVKFYSAGIEANTKDFYEIMEYCDEGNLWDFCKSGQNEKLSSSELLNIMEQITKGLVVLHQNAINHRDIKPQNIFIKTVNEKKVFKIGDFGYACIRNALKTKYAGTPQFMAPEYFNGEIMTNMIDIWALGLTFHVLLFGSLYFGIDEEKVKEKVMDKEYIYPIDKGNQKKLPQKMRNLLEGMMRKNPIDRWTANDVLKMIQEMQGGSKIQEESKMEITKPISQVQKAKSYRSIGNPIRLDKIKMNNGICFKGGIIKLANTNDQVYFTMDSAGKVQKIDAKNSNVLAQKQFDVGEGHFGCMITKNKKESCMLVSGIMNKNIYAIDPTEMKLIREWKATHLDYLIRVIFLDNEIFCAAYNDGLLKKFNLNSAKEIAKYKISNAGIISLFVEDNSKEILIGDFYGVLFSIDWEPFNKTKWNISIHQEEINSICKFKALILTGSRDESIAILNSNSPPTILRKITVGSRIYHLQFTPDNTNLLVLCNDKFILFKSNNEELNKVSEKLRVADFKTDAEYLQSFTFLNTGVAIVGDDLGWLYSVKLLEQTIIVVLQQRLLQ